MLLVCTVTELQLDNEVDVEHVLRIGL